MKEISMNKIALSIDTDFFFRELPIWDFSHNEENILLMNNVIWNIRYGGIDFLTESSLDYADCHPNKLFNKLFNKGFNFNLSSVGSGWSHSGAYSFFKSFEFNTLINIDAHHDCFSGKELHCGNWVLKLLEEKSDIKYHWVYPKFLKNTFGISAPKSVHKVSFSKIDKLAGEVVAIYIAQSPAWIPPHFDKYFLNMVRSIKLFTDYNKTIDDKYIKRKIFSSKQIKKVYAQYQSEFNRLKEIYQKKTIKEKKSWEA